VFASEIVAARPRPRGNTLRENTAYARVTQTPVAPNGLLVYWNTPGFFVDVAVGLSSKWSSFSGKSVVAETHLGPILKQLRPGAISVRTEGPGWVVDGTLGLIGDTLFILWLTNAE
jgi:hypothetical protein